MKKLILMVFLLTLSTISYSKVVCEGQIDRFGLETLKHDVLKSYENLVWNDIYRDYSVSIMSIEKKKTKSIGVVIAKDGEPLVSSMPISLKSKSRIYGGEYAPASISLNIDKDTTLIISCEKIK